MEIKKWRGSDTSRAQQRAVLKRKAGTFAAKQIAFTQKGSKKMENEEKDWSESYIKLEAQHKKLGDLLNDKKHEEAQKVITDMQADLLKLHNFAYRHSK